jgi:hypothetical protein
MIRPGGVCRKPGEGIELPEKTSKDHVNVFLGAELIELLEDETECFLEAADGQFRVEVPLVLEALAMLDEFFPIEGKYIHGHVD